MEHPATRYTKAPDGTHLAFATVGEGPVDFIYLAPWFQHLEFTWQEPRKARYLERLATFSRLILFDRRGQGLSDREPNDRPATIETRIDDIVAVMDAVGAKQAVVYGASETGPMAALFAAMRPERTLALVIHGTTPARSAWTPDWPTGMTLREHEAFVELIDRAWGTEAFVRAYFTEMADDPALIAYVAAHQRHAMSPGAAVALERWTYHMDVREALPAIRAPTLVLHRIEDDPQANRYFAGHIPGARLIQLPGQEHIPYLGDQDSVLIEIERFVRGLRTNTVAEDGTLATVLVASLSGAVRAVAQARRELSQLVPSFRGHLVESIDGLEVGLFDGSTRAVRCGLAVVTAAKALGASARVGVHVGEIHHEATRTTGLAVAIAAELHRRAAPSQVLASHAVRDMSIGSGVVFDEVAALAFEGSPATWRTYRATEPGRSPSAFSRVRPAREGRRWGDGRQGNVLPRLTPREGTVLRLLAAGRSDGEIAEELRITRKTASVHVSNIKGKLGAASRVETALLAQELRLAEGLHPADG
jgi:pimeloyl-ACP methyl ester carboxylesterase/DNA-binding NarL/FixJ family response regulator